MSAKKLSMDSIRGLVNMGREAEESMEVDLHIRVMVDPSAQDWLVCAVRDALVPERDARVDVTGLGYAGVVTEVDVGIVVAGGSDEGVRTAIRTFAGTRRSVIVVAASSLDVPQTNLPSKLGQYVSEAISSDQEGLYERLANAMLDATDKDVSCAANFAFCRDVATARLVSKCAARNAFMSVADFIPGAGMPLMTMNQINLCFDMAASYGRGMGVGRVPEVVAVACAGFAYRWAARTAARFVPILSLVFHIGFAYGGTLVTGRMLSTHYNNRLRSPAEVREDVTDGLSQASRQLVSKQQELKSALEEVSPKQSYITIGEGGSCA